MVPEVTYRDRLEHFARGYEWNYFKGILGLKSSDLNFWEYPQIKIFLKLILEVFFSNYVPWDANKHIELVKNQYKSFKISNISFDRTYRTMSI